MNLKVCDWCSEVIKNKAYYISITEVELPKQEDKLAQFVTLEEAFQLINKKQQELHKHTKYFEACQKCKGIFDYCLTSRKESLEEMNKYISGSFKLPDFKSKEDCDGV